MINIFFNILNLEPFYKIPLNTFEDLRIWCFYRISYCLKDSTLHRFFDIMWLLCFVVTLVSLMVDPGHSEAGLASTSFSNELRSGFTRLFQNGVEQPLQSPYILVNPSDFQSATNPLIQQLYQQRPAPFGPQLESTFYKPRPRYELQNLSWVIPYYYVPTRYHPPRGGRKPNDVLVVVIKTRSNCTSNNGTESDNPMDDDDDDDSDDVSVMNYKSAVYRILR